MNLRMAWSEFRVGLHSNIPLCCVLQYVWEEYGWGKRRPFREMTERVRAAQYRPCKRCWGLLERGHIKPNLLYCCDGFPIGEYAVVCPKCFQQ